MKLNKPQLKAFKRQLLDARAKCADEIRSIAKETSKNPREASGDLSGYTVHMADMSADTYERELSMGLVSSEQEVLYQIDEALKRMDEGTYGACQQCSKPISVSRLKAVPYTAQCITCQRAQEQKAKRAR
ncbi:MAG: TraR/DksA C4-type zinc finger protein [Candidatus Omnitrophica bacterium]|nr:TraR/DksA C4-type zinc finger protein [Candidatus Omnitrophota bacterium]